MADIFLSYSEKDRSTVSRLADTLQSVGWSVWWDRRIPAGSTWRSVLEHELQSMRCMVVLWSSNSVHSEWVCEEAAEGRQLGRLVPVSIDRVRPPAGFREIQAADLVDWDGSRSFLGLQRLLEDIERLIGKPGVVPPATWKATPVGGGDMGSVPTKPPPVPTPPTSATSARSPTSATSATSPTSPASPTPMPPARRLVPWGVVALLGLIAVGGYIGLVQRKPVATAGDLGRPPMPAAKASALPALSPAPSASLNTATLPASATGPAPAASKPPRPTASTDTRNSKTRQAINPRCAALLERLALGETLSGPSKSFFNQECRQ